MMENNQEKIIDSQFEDFENSNKEELKKDQIKNIYTNTLYFAILSIVFGLAYYFIIG